MCSGKDDCGKRYENDSCLSPGANGAVTRTRPFDAEIAAGEMSLSPTWIFAAPAGSGAVHVGCASSGETSVWSLSFAISYASTTSRDPSTFGDEIDDVPSLDRERKVDRGRVEDDDRRVVAGHASRW